VRRVVDDDGCITQPVPWPPGTIVDISYATGSDE
jgi:hypothetical protein